MGWQWQWNVNLRKYEAPIDIYFQRDFQETSLGATVLSNRVKLVDLPPGQANRYLEEFHQVVELAVDVAAHCIGEIVKNIGNYLSFYISEQILINNFNNIFFAKT